MPKSDPSSIFRKSALEKLSTPEQLDLLMTVTSPKGWVAVWAIGGVLAFTLFWGIFGAIPDKVQCSGILIRGGAVYDVVALGAGRVIEMKVKPGDVIEEGDVVAIVSQPELKLKRNNAQRELDKMILEDASMTEAEQQGLALEMEALETERSNLLDVRDDAEKMAGFLREKVATQEGLAKKGVLTRSTVLNTRNELLGAQHEVAKAELQVSQARSREISLRNQVKEKELQRRRAIDDIRRQLSEAEGQMDLITVVVSPYSGRVLELMVDRGNVVQAGARVLSLEDVDAKLSALMFIPADDGKKVQPGMEIRVSPTTVKREEYGAILGKVVSVADFPSTEEGINRTLRNETLAADLTGRGSAIEVFADLVPDSETTSGYEWTSSQGPPSKVVSGTIAMAEIVVGSQRPISIIIPFLRKQSGIY